MAAVYPWNQKAGEQAGNELLAHALRYAGMGWHVFPVHHIQPSGFCSCASPTCDRAGKHPRTQHGLRDASTDPAIIRHWWQQWPDANIGVRTGRVSGIFVLDVDTHPDKGIHGDESLQRLEEKNGRLPDTVEAMTGGLGGRHLVFRYPDAIEGAIKSRTSSLGAGLDVRGDGGYVIVYPSVGLKGRYEWEGSSDPLDGVAPVDAPAWLVQLVTSEIRHHDGGDYTGTGTGFLHPKTADELRDALRAIDPDESYDLWSQVGMALKSLDAGETAFTLWDEWSARGAKYKAGEMAYKWRSFSPGGGLNKESVFFWASQRGWVNPLSVAAFPTQDDPPRDEPSRPLLASVLEKTHIPGELLQIPGRLQSIVDWINRTAPKPQPAFAVQTALAIGSVVAGRKYMSSNRNFTSLWFMNVGESGCGKEHAKTAVEMVLEAAGYENLVNEGGYTSPGAIFTRLRSQPTHITVVDELGKMLMAAREKGGYHEKMAAKKLMESWGRLAGSMRPDQYSGMSLSSADSKKLDLVVRRPAITMLGMTTPGTLYDALTAADVADGFLGRFLVVETDIGRQPGFIIQDFAGPPESVLHWIRQVRQAGQGNLSTVEAPADQEPETITVHIDDAAMAEFVRFEAEVMEWRATADGESLGELFSRTHEIAMRVSLIVALSISPTTPVIDGEAAQWACRYVGHHFRRLFDQMCMNLGTGERGKLIKRTLEFIAHRGKRGATEGELVRRRNPRGPLRESTAKDRAEVINLLKAAGDIELVEIKGVRGPARVAWVAVEPASDDEEEAA